MNQKTHTCPSCGSLIEFDAKFDRVIACKYCQSILEFGKWELTQIGLQGELLEFPSLFQVEKTIQYKEKFYFTKGHIRFEYDGGFFDKFFVQVAKNEYGQTDMNSPTFWAQEDDGLVHFFEQNDWETSSIDLSHIHAGIMFSYNWLQFFAQEVGVLKIANMKGRFPSKLIPNHEYYYVDAIAQGQVFIFEQEVGVPGFLRVGKQCS